MAPGGADIRFLRAAWADLPWHPAAPAKTRGPTIGGCHAAGLCTAAGKCSCFANFFGPACERRVCPGGSAETGDCSGHGTCATMKQLSMLPNALPLSKNNVSGYHAGDHVPYYEHHAHGRDDGTWDAMPAPLRLRLRLVATCEGSLARRRGTRLSDHGLNQRLPSAQVRARRRSPVLRADLRGATCPLVGRPARADGARRPGLHGRAGEGRSRRRRAGTTRRPRRLLEPRHCDHETGQWPLCDVPS